MPNDVVNVWYQLDTDDPKTQTVRFQVFGTGDGPIPKDAYYRGTAIEPDTEANRHRIKLVMHVFEIELP